MALSKILPGALAEALSTALPAAMEHISKRVDAVEEELRLVKTKLERMEAQERRNNLVFFGLRENERETDEEAEESLRLMLDELLGIPAISIERCHRLGRRGTPNRPVIVKFSFFKEREMVLKKRSMLRGTRIFVDEDYPASLREKRERLKRSVKEVASKGERVSIRFPFDYARVGSRVIYPKAEGERVSTGEGGRVSTGEESVISPSTAIGKKLSPRTAVTKLELLRKEFATPKLPSHAPEPPTALSSSTKRLLDSSPPASSSDALFESGVRGKTKKRKANPNFHPIEKYLVSNPVKNVRSSPPNSSQEPANKN